MIAPSRAARALGIALGAAAASFAIAPLAVASAGDETAFTQAAFDAAQKRHAPILLRVEAAWCAACQQQKRVLAELRGQGKFDDLVILMVDYERQKNVVRQFRVRTPSTLIVFKGAIEEGILVGETSPKAIAILLGKAG